MGGTCRPLPPFFRLHLLSNEEARKGGLIAIHAHFMHHAPLCITHKLSFGRIEIPPISVRLFCGQLLRHHGSLIDMGRIEGKVIKIARKLHFFL